MEALSFLLMIFGPLIGGIVFGLLQLGVYQGLAAVGAVNRENIPIFPFLVLRGLLITLAIIATMAIYSYHSKPRGQVDPLHQQQGP